MTKKDNIDYLPFWKANATPEERLSEITAIARKHPEQFSNIIIIYEEVLPDGSNLTRYVSTNLSTKELLGLLDIARAQVHENTRL